MMTTSASICGRSMPSIGLRKWIMVLRGAVFLSLGFRFLDFFGERRDHVEEVAHNTIIGDLEDGGLYVFINRNNGARALHADDMLDGAADAERNVELGGHGLTRTANLPLGGHPAVVADRA